MSARGTTSTFVRLVLAAVSFVLSLMALRAALRRFVAALVAWVIGGVLFVTGLLLVLSATWRFVRTKMRYRRHRA